MAQVPPRFIVCSNPRSGSGLLCGLLQNTGLLGPPVHNRHYETLNPNRRYSPAHVDWEQQDVRALFEQLFAEYGWFKMHWHHMAHLVRCARKSSRHRSLTPDGVRDQLSPSTRFIFLYREDKMAQAASVIKALASGRWSHRNTDQGLGGEGRPDASLYSICYHMEEARRWDDLWRRFFRTNQVECFAFSYEELSEDKKKVVTRSLEFLGIDAPDDVTIQADRSKQADAFNAAIVSKYEGASPQQRSLYHLLCRRHVRLKAWLADHRR